MHFTMSNFSNIFDEKLYSAQQELLIHQLKGKNKKNIPSQHSYVGQV